MGELLCSTPLGPKPIRLQGTRVEEGTPERSKALLPARPRVRRRARLLRPRVTQAPRKDEVRDVQANLGKARRLPPHVRVAAEEDEVPEVSPLFQCPRRHSSDVSLPSRQFGKVGDDSSWSLASGLWVCNVAYGLTFTVVDCYFAHATTCVRHSLTDLPWVGSCRGGCLSTSIARPHLAHAVALVPLP